MGTIAITRNGRFVAFRQPDGIHVVDALGPTPRRTLPIDRGGALACIGRELWASDASGRGWRCALGDDAAPASLAVDGAISRIVPLGDTSAIVETAGGITLVDAELHAMPAMRVLCGHGRRVVVADGDGAALRTLGRDGATPLHALRGEPRGAAFVFGGRAIAAWQRDAIVVATTAGQLVHRIAVPALGACAIADDAALAIIHTGDELRVIDLRHGQLRMARPFADACELVTDARGRRLVIARDAPEGASWVSVVEFDDLFAGRADEPPAPAEPADPPVWEPIEPGEATERLGDAVREEPVRPPLLPLALAPAALPPIACDPTTEPPFADAGEHLAALLDVVAARTALAIAESWHSGRTSHDGDGDLPCEREVLGLVGDPVGLAADAVTRARTRMRDQADRFAARTRSSIAAGIALPFHELAREYALSPIATQILACAAAPRLRAAIGRLYGVLAGVTGRATCSDELLELLVEVPPGDSLARELAPDAPLVRCGLIALQPHADRVAVTVDAVLVDRLRGLVPAAEISAATQRRVADRALDALVVPREVLRELLEGLAEHDREHPARVVVRGRRGAGRHTLIAALAAEVRRPIAMIDTLRLPRSGIAAALALELVRASIAGCLPVVSGLEAIDRADALAIQTVLRRHAGPVAVRATPEGDLPIDPERIEVALPALTLGERRTVWQRALADHRLPAVDDDALALLAARFRFGPGTIERVAAQVARRFRDGPLAPLVDQIARQHIAGRLERVATRITRLADWDQVTLLDDMRDSVRELIGRMRHQRTVYEEWGFERRIATARGLTALFYGPPGTGKTLVAGLIGRELGLDVWRIDLARVMSKWIGETEKSLAEVFEAAEEGQVLLLFDEADSLFGKRTDPKSSTDRYANLEVNYLLQRLDSFEGVAILTTNLEGSIDPAFKRRLSMRLYFPFPDEELRAQLWAAHVPPSVPCAGPLDFADLARRYPLSGGYIRNSALRAAFLAAQERRPLSQDHLLRAVQLEYRELGKLSTSGRMD